ncbi:hypothetical protein CR513_05450, partial [Mucuna pruriens]
SSSDPLYELDLEIELTLRRLRKARNIVVSNSRNSDSISSFDNNNFATNSSNSVEYSSTNIFTEPGQMENNDKIVKELATLDIVYQPWCIQYPQLEPAQTYELKSGLIHLRRPPQIFERIPCDLFHIEAVEDTKRLHQDEGILILLGWRKRRTSCIFSLFSSTPGRHEPYILGEVLSGIQNFDHQEGNLWDKATIRRNSVRVLGKIQQIVCHLSISSDQ